MTLDEAKRLLGGEIQPSPDEARNGWTSASLTVYTAERQAAAYESIISPKRPRPDRTENRLRWP